MAFDFQRKWNFDVPDRLATMDDLDNLPSGGVDATGVLAGRAPVADGENGWEWQEVIAGATALDDLTDVVTAGATSGQILAFDGTQWEPQTVAASGGSAPTFVFHGNNTTQARPAVDHVVWVGLLEPENGYAPADTWVKADIGTLPMSDTSPYMATVMSDSPAAYWRLGGLDRPVFTASASSSYYSEGPDGALKDNSEGSRWTTNGGATGWLRAEYLDAVAADKYVLQRRDDIPARNPTAWTFEGSNDGATWTVLDTRTGITWPTASAHRLFKFTNTTEYLYYRINVTANGGDGYLSIAGMWIGEYHGSMVADYSGNSHAGAWDIAPATYGAAGLITATSDKAAYCDAVTDSRVTVPYGAWMNMETGMAAEIIIKPIAAAGRKRSMMQRHGLFNLRLNAENQPEVNYNSGALVLTSATALTMGQTYHVVYSYDATANSMTLYVNGAQVATVGGVTLTSGTTEILRIGSISGTADERWAGTLDEAALYTAPLSGARVLAHYNAAVAV